MYQPGQLLSTLSKFVSMYHDVRSSWKRQIRYGESVIILRTKVDPQSECTWLQVLAHDNIAWIKIPRYEYEYVPEKL